MKHALLCVLACLLLTACAEEKPPVEIEVYERVDSDFGIISPEIKVISLVESVEVKNIEVNRGNCDMFRSYAARFPTKLAFGESVSAIFSSPCDVRQVDVATDQDEWSLAF